MKRKIVVAADMGWAVGRIHKDLEMRLSHRYDFVFFNSSNCVIQDFVKSAHDADVVLTTYNLYNDMIRLFSDPAILSKIVMVCHGYPDIVYINRYDHNLRVKDQYAEDVSNPKKILILRNHHPDLAYPLKADLNQHITYAVTSDVLLPFFSNIPKVWVTPNGVDDSHFSYKQRSSVKQLGWCGALVGFKRHSIALTVASRTKLPLSYASSLSFEALKEWYHTIDILIVTAGPAEYDETGPLPPFEAVVSGCVVLGFPVGNFQKIPGPRCTSVQDIVDAVHTLQTHPHEFQRLAQEQYAFVKHHWTMSTLVEEWVKALEASLHTQSMVAQRKN